MYAVVTSVDDLPDGTEGPSVTDTASLWLPSCVCESRDDDGLLSSLISLPSPSSIVGSRSYAAMAGMTGGDEPSPV